MPAENKRIIFLIIALCALVSWGIFSEQNLGTIKTTTARERRASMAMATATLPRLGNLTIEGKAGIVVDINSGTILFEKNSDWPLPLASLTKVMTALVASDKLGPEDRILISPDSLKQEGDSGLRVGEEWRLSDLLDFTLVSSSNDGAHAIAAAVAESLPDHDFVGAMNRKAEAIGLTQTRFINETGLDLDREYSGSYGTAREMAKLFAFIIKNRPGLMAATKKSEIERQAVSGVWHNQKNTNKIAAVLPGLRASKTGFTDIADGNLAVVVDRGLNQPVAIVVLGSSQDGRFRDVEKLVSALFN